MPQQLDRLEKMIRIQQNWDCLKKQRYCSSWLCSTYSYSTCRKFLYTRNAYENYNRRCKGEKSLNYDNTISKKYKQEKGLKRLIR